MRILPGLLPLALSFSAFALDPEHVPQDNGLSNNELRDKKVQDAIIGSRKDQDFSLYKLNYAIANDEDLLLQYSFKYRMIDELYLAYTNLVLWDIYDAEQPAIDNNFMPEIFYRLMLGKPWLTSVDAGWFHRSNGSSGPMSRAWDRWQLRFNSGFDWKHLNILWQTTVYADLKKSSKNEDINDYSGPWDTGIAFRNLLGQRNNQLDLGIKLVSGYEGYKFNTGQKAVTLQYRMRWAQFKPTLLVQYFNGYGEVIKFYNQKTESLRLGISFHY